MQVLAVVRVPFAQRAGRTWCPRLFAANHRCRCSCRGAAAGGPLVATHTMGIGRARWNIVAGARGPRQVAGPAGAAHRSLQHTPWNRSRSRTRRHARTAGLALLPARATQERLSRCTDRCPRRRCAAGAVAAVGARPRRRGYRSAVPAGTAAGEALGARVADWGRHTVPARSGQPPMPSHVPLLPQLAGPWGAESGRRR